MNRYTVYRPHIELHALTVSVLHENSTDTEEGRATTREFFTLSAA